MPEDMSSIDIRILEQIQRDASLSTGDLAERVGLSQSPCWRRLQRLKEEGYIRRQVAILDRSKFASSMFIMATLKMTTLSDDKRAEFVRKIELSPEILECYTIFGERDIMLKVIVPSLPWYQKFVFDFILKLPGVQDVQSTVTIAEIKHTTEIPIRPDRVM